MRELVYTGIFLFLAVVLIVLLVLMFRTEKAPEKRTSISTERYTAGFRKWIRNDLYPGNFRHQYHCLAYAFDGSALRIKVALINTSYVETYTLRPTVAGDSATAIHPQLTCSWQPNVTYLPPAPDNTWHFTATRKPE